MKLTYFIFLIFFFIPFIFISWRLITLQYCSGFCHTFYNGKTFSPSLEESGMSKKCPLSPLLSNTVLEALAKAWKIKRQKRYKDSKGKDKTIIIFITIIIHSLNLKFNKLLQLIGKFNKMAHTLSKNQEVFP